MVVDFIIGKMVLDFA